jgi:hypothetical protein
VAVELVLVAIAAIVVVGALVSVIVLRRGRTSPSREVAPSAGSGVPSTRQDGLAARVRSLFAGGATGQDEWARLEELLVRADVGPQTAARIVRDVRARYTPSSDPVALLHDELVAILGGDGRLALRPDDLSVVMVVGVNGSGKTTTIGKLAARLSREGARSASPTATRSVRRRRSSSTSGRSAPARRSSVRSGVPTPARSPSTRCRPRAPVTWTW